MKEWLDKNSVIKDEGFGIRSLKAMAYSLGPRLMIVGACVNVMPVTPRFSKERSFLNIAYGDSRNMASDGIPIRTLHELASILIQFHEKDIIFSSSGALSAFLEKVKKGFHSYELNKSMFNRARLHHEEEGDKEFSLREKPQCEMARIVFYSAGEIMLFVNH